MEEFFAQYNVDGSGKMNTDEFREVLTRPGGDAIFAMMDAESVLADFDKNGDGKLDMEEFISAMAVIDIGSGEELKASAEANLLASEGIEERNAAFMATNAKMDEMLEGYARFAESDRRNDERHSALFKEYFQVFRKWHETHADVRSLLFRGRGVVHDAADNLVPEPPDLPDDCDWCNHPEAKKWMKDMDDTAKPFKEAMAISTIDAIKASPEWAALHEKIAALNARMQEIHTELNAVLADMGADGDALAKLTE